MKKIITLLLIFLWLFHKADAQLPYTIDFENPALWELNVAQPTLNATVTASNFSITPLLSIIPDQDNRWIINNNYDGGIINNLNCPLPCIDIPIPPIPNQSNLITNPNKNYLHILAYIGTKSIPPVLSAHYNGSLLNQRHCFARMKNDISTVGFSDVKVNFWHVGGKGQSIYFSTDKGQTWTELIDIEGIVTEWTEDFRQHPGLNNQATVRLGILWSDEKANGVDATAIDEIMITGSVAPTIATQDISPAAFCTGQTVNIGFTTSGTFANGNVFTAQLSDANGSFANPIAIGTVSSVSSGTITATIPAGTLQGSGYRIRVVSSNPAVTGTNNGSNLIINSVPLQPVIAASGNTVFCQGGKVTLTASTAAGYVWSNGATTQSIEVSQAGSYTVIVKNASNCQSIASQATVVTVHPLPTQPAITVTGNTTLCLGQSLTLTAPAASGYKWSNGAVTQSIQVSQAGTYRVQIFNTNNCESPLSAPVAITVNPLPTTPVITASGPTTIPPGGNVLLSTSQQNGVSYQWKKDGINIGSNNPSFSATAAGNYTVTVSNSCGSVTSDAIAVTLLQAPGELEAYFPFNGNANDESGNRNNGTVNGATLTTDRSDNCKRAYNFSGNGQMIDAGTNISLRPASVVSISAWFYFNQLQDYSGIGNVWDNDHNESGYGLYIEKGKIFFVVRTSGTSAWYTGGVSANFNNCAATITSGAWHHVAGVYNGTKAVLYIDNVKVAECTANGLIDYNFPNHFYIGAFKDSNEQFFMNGKIDDIRVFSRAITSTEIAGFYQEKPVSNKIPAIPTITASGTTSICNGENVVLSIPSQAGVTYQWQKDGVNIGTNSPSFAASLAGNYTIVLSNECGSVTSSNSIEVTIQSLPVAPTISSASSTTICPGENVSLSVPAQNGVTYQWRKDGTTIGQNAPSFTATAAGVYSVVLTNACGNTSSTNTVSVQVLAVPPAVTITPSGVTTFCTGGNVSLSVPATSNISYQWKKDGIKIGTHSPVFIASASGIYSVELSNTCGTTVSNNTIQVTVNTTPAPPTITASGPTSFCKGGNVILSVPQVSGATYQWRRNGEKTGNSHASFTAAQTGTYTVELITACSTVASSNSINIIINEAPIFPQITQIGNSTICKGDSVILVALSPTGTDYQWKKDGLNMSNSAALKVTETGNYSVSVSNACGSVSSHTISITVHDLPVIPTITASGPTTICPGESVVLSTPIQAGVSYQWKKDGAATGIDAPTITATTSGNYSVTVTNTCGHSSSVGSVTVLVGQPTAPVVNHTERCGPGKVTLTASGTPNSTYLWYETSTGGNAIQSSSKNTLEVTLNSSRTYYVSVSNGNCESSKVPLTATILPVPVAQAGNDVQINLGETTRLNGTGGVSYAWSPAAGLDNAFVATPLASPTATTTYTLTVTSEEGCTATDQVTVVVIENLSIPNTFTPNNDGVNDSWVIKNIENFPDCKLEVFNRWGSKVYESNGYTQPWNGTAQGKELPVTTYYYIISLGGGKKPLQGSVSIIR